ncbi:hypothetical protein WME95_43845 [Sorangium sp. So ce327]|uniref:DUF4145 domain-containing protein n=1 Tax=Sorangium sp. So ce327 TaxID=3133301 RepID=UPI003F634E8D
MKPEKIKDNFDSLIREGKAVLGTKRGESAYPEVDARASRKWITSVLALTRSVFGESSAHYVMATELERKQPAFKYSLVDEMFGVLGSAADAWERGYVFEMKHLVEAEVEASLMDQAEELLDKRYYQPAAVLAGSVLEQHLRSMCSSHGVDTHGPNGKPLTLEPLNLALCKAGAYDTNTQKHITSLGGIRNSAAHDAKATAEEARRIVQEVPGLCGRLR